MKSLSQVKLSDEEIDRLKAVKPGVEVVVGSGRENELQEIIDADIYFGRIPRSIFLEAKTLRWVPDMVVNGKGILTPALS